MTASSHYKNWTVSIFKDESCKDFVGTGFLLSQTHVLSCEHVIQEGGEWAKPPTGSEGIKLGVIQLDPQLDIAIASLDKELGIEPVAVLVEGIDKGIIENLLAENCICWGYYPPKDYSLGVIKSDKTTNSKKLQFDGAPEKGHSGSPVLFDVYRDYGVFGMLFLGGENSGQSRIIRSDAIIQWLRDLKIKDLSLKTVTIDEVLRRIAFGDRDWSQVVREQWLDKWGYARNREGIYVGADGQYPLCDNQGKPISEFNRDTESIIRQRGLNTGSIEYAKLYEEDHERFGAHETDEEIVQEQRERFGIEDRA